MQIRKRRFHGHKTLKTHELSLILITKQQQVASCDLQNFRKASHQPLNFAASSLPNLRYRPPTLVRFLGEG